MFEKTTLTTAKVLYWLAIGSAAIWLAWACFVHLPFVVALVLFPVAFVLLAAFGSPLAAGAAFISGMVVAGCAFIGRKATASLRSGA